MNNKLKMLLITGGFGFIGSHTVLQLINDYDLLIIDNLSNSDLSILDKMENVSGKKIKYEIGCLTDLEFLRKCFQKYEIDGVIHFAAYKNVYESIIKPLDYYYNNLNGLLNLLKCCENVKKFIFSSSCTVYGNKNQSPLIEKDIDDIDSTTITNPYGNTKYMCEKILKDFSKTNNMIIVCLRYFNPVGCHSSKLIGEESKNQNNLMPVIINSIKNEEKVKIFGNNYNTKDGTCIRDYIHIMDLAEGHKKALNFNKKGYHTFNLGTGTGISVLEMLKCVNEIYNIEYEYVQARDGDLESAYANIDKSNKLLNFKSQYNLYDICYDSLKFNKII
jgi:UDP-glucose 4-epimerase